MDDPFPYPLLTNPGALARLGEWSEEVYRDFEAVRDGRMSEADLRAKYQRRTAILCLDMTGFTASAMVYGEVESLLRIRDAQTVCVPVLAEAGSRLVRAFADDLVALFDDAPTALNAALEMHRRIAAYNRSGLSGANPAECCIGIGYGDVLAIGPNLAMGDEMNRASKLGEDTARANETLITQNVYEAVRGLPEYAFTPQNADDLPFPFYAVTLRAEN